MISRARVRIAVASALAPSVFLFSTLLLPGCLSVHFRDVEFDYFAASAPGSSVESSGLLSETDIHNRNGGDRIHGVASVPVGAARLKVSGVAGHEVKPRPRDYAPYIMLTLELPRGESLQFKGTDLVFRQHTTEKTAPAPEWVPSDIGKITRIPFDAVIVGKKRVVSGSGALNFENTKFSIRVLLPPEIDSHQPFTVMLPATNAGEPVTLSFVRKTARYSEPYEKTNW